MINFVKLGTIYCYVLDCLINPIIKYLNDYEINTYAKDDCINVHFFNEPDYSAKYVGKGVNVLIAHGLGDKSWRNSRRDNKFDFVIAPSDYWKEVLISRKIEENKIYVAGHPKIDMFFNGELNKSETNNINILWCPTHNSCANLENSASSYPNFLNYIDLIPNKYNVVQHPHPFNEKDNKVTLQDLIDADVVITDFSSMIYEAWILNKPIIFPDWIVKKNILQFYSGTIEHKIYTDGIGYHANSIEELVDLIDVALKNGLDKNSSDFIEKVFPTKYRGESGKYIANFLMGLRK